MTPSIDIYLCVAGIYLSASLEDHVPGEGSGDRSLLGAACHGCQLIAETSCEARNLYLDRNLIVSTMAASPSLPLFD